MPPIERDLHATVQELMVEIAILRTRLEEKDKALTLQAFEYERRLDSLNNSHEEARETLKNYGSTYLTIERFDRFFNEEHLPWRRKVDEVIVADKSGRAYLTAAIATMFALISIGIQAWDLLLNR